VRKGVKKRIRRHMRENGCGTVQAYIGSLEENKDVRRQCDRLMMVSISRFFRDRWLWERLEAILLPDLFTVFADGISVWSAGCACGEEAYSLAILYDRLQRKDDHPPTLSILATDADPACLSRSKAGIYPKSSLKEVPEEIRSAYFSPRKGGKQYEVKNNLRSRVVFRQGDLLADPISSEEFHIILLRNNLLTYYQEQVKVPALRSIVNCLAKNGLLIIGSHEEMPPGMDVLKMRFPSIYEKI
jgi:chemotaxis methyl-accepting protein methylase